MYNPANSLKKLKKLYNYKKQRVEVKEKAFLNSKMQLLETPP